MKPRTITADIVVAMILAIVASALLMFGPDLYTHETVCLKTTPVDVPIEAADLTTYIPQTSQSAPSDLTTTGFLSSVEIFETPPNSLSFTWDDGSHPEVIYTPEDILAMTREEFAAMAGVIAVLSLQPSWEVREAAATHLPTPPHARKEAL